MSPAAFRALSLALHNLSSRELELCSPRRLLTTVLSSEGVKYSIYLSVNWMHLPSRCAGWRGAINIRIDSRSMIGCVIFATMRAEARSIGQRDRGDQRLCPCAERGSLSQSNDIA
jgi:hypothetical protein